MAFMFLFFHFSNFILYHISLAHHVLALLFLFLFLADLTLVPILGVQPILSPCLEFPDPVACPPFAWLAPSHSRVISA